MCVPNSRASMAAPASSRQAFAIGKNGTRGLSGLLDVIGYEEPVRAPEERSVKLMSSMAFAVVCLPQTDCCGNGDDQRKAEKIECVAVSHDHCLVTDGTANPHHGLMRR